MYVCMRVCLDVWLGWEKILIAVVVMDGDDGDDGVVGVGVVVVVAVMIVE